MRSLIQHLVHAAQWQPLPGREQVENHAGGYVFAVDRWTRLERFLVLGSEGGTYYVEERELTLESAYCVFACLAEDAPRTVEAIAAISRAGRAPSNRPALFALAIAFCEETAVPSARARFSDIVRTGSHLFEFLAAVRALRGFGRSLRGAIADWYLEKPVDRLAYQLVKYRRRSGWTHRDALRLCHAKDQERNALFAWAVGHEAGDLPPIVRGFSLAQTADAAALPELIRTYRLTHEMVPSHALRDPSVLRALAESMPIAALVRYLGRLSKAGLLRGHDPLVDRICERLGSAEEIRAARLHPMALLVALRTYARGRGMAGKLS
ncbi:MAG: TROVE domain-containing protein [Planctomycetota bacterium]